MAEEVYTARRAGPDPVARRGALITPALFSQPSTHPDGEKRERLVSLEKREFAFSLPRYREQEEDLQGSREFCFLPLLPVRAGGGLGEEGRGDEGQRDAYLPSATKTRDCDTGIFFGILIRRGGEAHGISNTQAARGNRCRSVDGQAPPRTNDRSQSPSRSSGSRLRHQCHHRQVAGDEGLGEDEERFIALVEEIS